MSRDSRPGQVREVDPDGKRTIFVLTKVIFRCCCFILAARAGAG